MGKLCKILAVLILVCGIIGSLVLAGTTRPHPEYPLSMVLYNIDYAIAIAIGSILLFAVLYAFGTLVTCAQRIDKNLAALLTSRNADAQDTPPQHTSAETQAP